MTTAPVALKHRVGGAWIGGTVVAHDINPARPAEVVSTIPAADPATLLAAAAEARAALPSWARQPAALRGQVLQRASVLLDERADAIGKELSREEGKTISEALSEVQRAAAILSYWAGRTYDASGEVYPASAVGRRIETRREPLGIVVVITPWNFPIAIPAWKIGPALAYGNVVLFKPSSSAPLSAYRLIEALTDAGLPPGVVNTVFCPGALVGDEWLGRGAAHGVTFTGSVNSGLVVSARAQSAGFKVQLELGGKNAVIVAADADVDLAADQIVRGAMANAGQKCTATARVIALDQIHDRLRNSIVERIAGLLPGDPLDPTTSLGPLIDDRARLRVGRLVEDARARGATIIEPVKVPADGFYSPPLLIEGTTDDMAISSEEVFGPVVSISAVDSLEAAIRLHNTTPFGLSGSIFTRSLDAAHLFSTAAQVGIAHVNGETAGAEPHVPFGGMKESSSGTREQGGAAREFYTQLKTIYWDGLPDIGYFDLMP